MATNENEEAKNLHCDLMRELAVEYLAEDANKTFYKKFLQNVKKCFTTPRQKGLKEVDAILEELRGLGVIGVGKYDVLLELTEGIDKDLTKLIIQYKEKIEGVLKTANDNVEAGVSSTSKKRKHEMSEADDDLISSSKMPKVFDTGSGAEFRKGHDTSVKTREIQLFFDRKFVNSVGSIDLGTGSTGTGFSIGSKYIMSANHVFRRRLDQIWDGTVECIEEDSNRHSNWVRLSRELQTNPVPSTSPEEGIRQCLELWRKQNPTEFKITELLDALGSAGFTHSRDRLNDFLQKEWHQKCVIRFGPNKEHTFALKIDIPYMNQEKDVIIVELAIPLVNTNLPKSFRLQRSLGQLKDEMHLIGYPRMHDGHQIIDPRCEVIHTVTKKQMAIDSMREAVSWFKNQFPNDLSNFEHIYHEEVETRINDHSSFILFHSSESTAHGASGCPGIVDLDSERPVVQAMLQSGCPAFTYSRNTNGAYYRGTKIPLQYLFEKGITMSKVHDLLENKVALRDDLFYNVQ